MANYNPNAPQILGQEWVPIRNESLVLNPFANSLERGYTFTLTSATAINQVRFYLKDWPKNFGSSMIYTASVYQQGQEASSGPVRSVIIPSGSVVITGANLTPINSTGASQDLFANGDNMFIYWVLGNGATGQPGMSIFFQFNPFAQLLYNKRILGVDLLIGINVVSQGTEVDDISQAINVYVANDTWDPINVTDTFRLPDLITNKTPASTIGTVRMHLGDANRFYGVGSGSTAGVHNIQQWTYTELARFEASAANRLRVILTEGFSPAANLGPEVQIEYAAMEVFYCEESRVLTGSRIFNDDIPNRPLRDPFTLGMNAITVRSPVTLSESGSLAAGRYTVAISESNMGDNYYASVYRTTAQLNEVRQLYELNSIPGVQVNMPFPLNENTVGQTFTKESTNLIPQLTLATSTGAVIEASHVYGQQSVGQVWGTNVVNQQIDDRFIGAARQWPDVRFYARRFGDTTTPLKLSSLSPTVSGSGMSVQITPTEFDALDEITDGWKAVTLTFPSPPTMGNSIVPIYRWSAFGETAGNRWEVLGATAPAVSGFAYTVVNTPVFNQVPTGEQLWLGTYGTAVSGAVIHEDWMPQWGPYVSGSTSDFASDAVILFSQYIPPVTGFTVTTASQAITGIGLDCGINPCGIPSAILYNQLQWSLPVLTGLAQDSYTRTVVNGFGSADRGGPYTLTATAAEYAVNGSAGVVTPAAASVNTFAILPNIAYDADMTMVTSASTTILTGTSVRAHLVARYTNLSNYYAAFIQTNPATGISIVALEKNVGGSGAILGTADISRGIDNANKLKLRFQIQGQFLKVKAWSPYLPEPTGWQLEISDSSLTFGTGVGVGGQSRSATGNSIVIDDFLVQPPDSSRSYYELQRMDSITSWQTIMKATGPAVTGFRDYEARVGMSSSYRIRAVGPYEFPGTWSSTVSINTPAPGVSGTCLTGAHIMIFTTNEHQSGYSNLAYSNAWESQVSEDFSFAEASFTQLQPMYGRDFFTAFRPLERGGDQFSRSVLVQAAAISPATLPGFTALSDMAWTNVSYICVRDEDGNRWFANVNVPAGTVQNRRRLYMANVQIVEVTDTPSPVNPI